MASRHALRENADKADTDFSSVCLGFFLSGGRPHANRLGWGESKKPVQREGDCWITHVRVVESKDMSAKLQLQQGCNKSLVG